jgi:hypothetical protein
MNDHRFADQVLSQVPAHPVRFPRATYDPDGDCIEFLLSNESYYARRIDSLITVYRSQESNEIVGSLITGVRKFLTQVLQRAPGFKVEIRDGRILLQHIFTAWLWCERVAAENQEVHLYNFLRARAEEAGAEVEVPELLAA